MYWAYILFGFGRAEFAEIDSLSVDTDEGGVTVVAHFGRRG